MRRTKLDAEKTKDLILNAAIKEISLKGYSSTRLQDIAKRANVTRGAIYHYYENKNAILYDIHERHKKRISNMIINIETETNQPIKHLKEAFLDVFKRFEEDEEYRQIEELFIKIEFASIMKEDDNLREKFQTDMCENQERVIKLIKNAQSKGIVRKDIVPENIALTITSFYIGLTTLWFTKILNFSIKEKAENYIDILFNGILTNKNK